MNNEYIFIVFILLAGLVVWQILHTWYIGVGLLLLACYLIYVEIKQ